MLQGIRWPRFWLVEVVVLLLLLSSGGWREGFGPLAVTEGIRDDGLGLLIFFDGILKEGKKAQMDRDCRAWERFLCDFKLNTQKCRNSWWNHTLARQHDNMAT